MTASPSTSAGEAKAGDRSRHTRVPLIPQQRAPGLHLLSTLPLVAFPCLTPTCRGARNARTQRTQVASRPRRLRHVLERPTRAPRVLPPLPHRLVALLHGVLRRNRGAPSPHALPLQALLQLPTPPPAPGADLYTPPPWSPPGRASACASQATAGALSGALPRQKLSAVLPSSHAHSRIASEYHNHARNDEASYTQQKPQ